MVGEVTKEELRFLKYFSPLDMNIHSPGVKIMPEYSVNDLALLFCYGSRTFWSILEDIFALDLLCAEKNVCPILEAE